ncbi:MAG TPA: acetate--CoA ligase family protein [Acidimicrobiales bacterium]|jgi:acetyl-CoA synthetase|nr:acetate--CoA ligase family protein [Acidimicrobiales bacterium]MDP6213720.1 acetate--CoA ligase family protein [Acidimicrobiales bacterium]MDP7209050.1 acetate--CoA ligase family protein [Acidimicrobiales bacterium]HJL90078.1 acetate--CoA ligase family protein [Acidimicrobiales bacterium]|tara:strand:+ start:27055 stop:29079 length:2025 start_codon:yes stop_codon:yes gene_type:complete
MANATPLSRLLEPRTLAFVGGNPAEIAIRQCMTLGFAGDLWPVHPHRSEMAGLPVFPSLGDLPSPPDAVLVAVNCNATIEVVGQLAEMGAGAAICYASGYAEVGGEGVGLQEALVAAAGDMPLVGPNCYGTVSATVGAALWPDQQGLSRVDRGVALITQSGNIGLNLTMQDRVMDISHVLTLGNQAGLGVEDCMEALVGDSSVSGIGLHVEALGDIARFEAACHVALNAGIPVVALKTGSSDRGALIAASHTSSLVGNDAAYGALFERLGVRRVHSIPELLDTLLVMEQLGPLQGRRIVSLSCSGGEASVVADSAEVLDLEFHEFDPDHAGRIADTLTELVAVSNPLDYHTFIWGDQVRLTRCFTEVMDGPVDAAVLVLDFPREGLDDSGWWPTLHSFVDASRETGTPGVVASSMAENMPAEAEEAVASAGQVAVRGIVPALSGLEAAAWWGGRRRLPAVDRVAGLSSAQVTITEHGAKSLLAEVGIRVPERELVDAGEAALAAERIGWPVVVKRSGDAHKTESGGVALDLVDSASVQEAADRMGGKVLVERQVDGTLVEMLVAVRREPPVGWLLTLGVGGILVEVIADTRSLLLPASATEVVAALEALAIWPLLAEHRGRRAGNLDAIIGVVESLRSLVLDRPDLVEVEINPLLVLADGAVAVDALITLEVHE